MTIMMTRSNGRIEEIEPKRLSYILYATNKKSGSRELSMKQCSAIAHKIMESNETTFCGRKFVVKA